MTARRFRARAKSYGSIWALFHSALFDPVLPFLVGGNRSIDIKTAKANSTRVVIANAARLNNPTGPRGDPDVSYRNSESFDLTKATGTDLGKFSINYLAAAAPARQHQHSDSTASYVGTDNAVTMTLSGQPRPMVVPRRSVAVVRRGVGRPPRRGRALPGLRVRVQVG